MSNTSFLALIPQLYLPPYLSFNITRSLVRYVTCKHNLSPASVVPVHTLLGCLLWICSPHSLIGARRGLTVLGLDPVPSFSKFSQRHSVMPLQQTTSCVPISPCHLQQGRRSNNPKPPARWADESRHYWAKILQWYAALRHARTWPPLPR